LDPEPPAIVLARKFDDDVWVGVLAPVVTFPVVVTTVATGSDGIDVGIAMETAVTLPPVKSEVGMVASGDAVTGTLKMLHISAIA
jgi:hypothetical protein